MQVGTSGESRRAFGVKRGEGIGNRKRGTMRSRNLISGNHQIVTLLSTPPRNNVGRERRRGIMAPERPASQRHSGGERRRENLCFFLVLIVDGSRGRGLSLNGAKTNFIPSRRLNKESEQMRDKKWNEKDG